ncbi:MAG: carbohydrate ABC transporter permease, partial [Gammaproteobacteria bacterium]|nr:carbohydrate ABC transporter permease [Gammaproteobacteria bacterium]
MKRRTLHMLARYAMLVAVTVVFLFPVYWLFAISF